KVKTFFLVAEYCTRVFWDVVDFPFPKGLAPETIYQRMKSILEKMGCINHYLSIMAYVNNSETFPDKTAYEKAGINIVTQPERHRFMLRDMAWWDVDSGFLPNFGKITFMVIISQIEPSLLVFLEGLRNAYKVRLAVPDEDTSLSSSPNLLDNTVRFESLYKSLLLQDDMTREVVVPLLFYPPIQTKPPPLYYPPIQTSPLPSPPIQIYNRPGVFLDLPESLLLACDPYRLNSYIRTSLCFDDGFSIMAYVVDTQTSSFPEGWVDAFTSLGITIIPQQAELGAPRAHKMSLDIVLWALDNTATYFQPRDLFVFSGNVKQGTDFYNALEALRDRYYNVRVLPLLETSWPHPHHQMSLHHCPPREEVVGFSHGVASLYKQNLKVCGVSVFWDVQGCPTDLSVILQALRNKGYRGMVVLIPYLDMDYQGDELFTYDGYACVPSIKVQGDKYTKVARMLLDILFWAMNHDDYARNLMLISQPSKDIDIFAQALERRFFNVIFKPSHEVAIDHRFESLCKSPPHPNSQTRLKSPCRTLTDLSRERNSCPVRISWLVDTCPSKPSDFWNLFSSTLELKGYGGFESVIAYVEKGKTDDEVIKVCTKSGLHVRLTPDGDEFGKFNLMVTDMINLTYSCGPYNFLVISSKPFRDVLCDTVFEDFKSRGCNVLFETVDYMVTFGSTLWSAKSFLDTSFTDSSQALA
ncbi:unnamed protein product, partial [Brassica rapa subsp. trilocularis]